ALVGAVVDQALDPILTWTPDDGDAPARVADLLGVGLPVINAFEATFKAALRLSLEQWAQDRAGTLGEEPEFKRGHRVELLKSALRPLEGSLEPVKLDRLGQALSMFFGVETLTVMKDIWGLDSQETQSVAQWAARALIGAAMEDDR